MEEETHIQSIIFTLFLKIKYQNPFVLAVDKIVVSCVNARHGVSDNDP